MRAHGTDDVLFITSLNIVFTPLEFIPDLQPLGQQWRRVMETQDLELFNQISDMIQRIELSSRSYCFDLP